MLNRFFGDHTHRYLHLLGLCGLAFGVPMNKVVMSISMMFLALNLLLEARFIEGLKNLRNNKLYLLLFAFFLLHLASMFWSTNLDYALHDLRVKIPLFIIPTIIIARPLKSRFDLHLVLGAFLLSTFLASAINFSMYQHWIGSHQYDDIRGMSLFSSHIRFAIIVSMSVAILLYFLKYYKGLRMPIFLFIGWFAYYTFYSQVISGASTFLGVLITFAIYLLWGKHKIIAIALTSTFALAIIGLAVWLIKPVNVDPKIFENLPAETAEGNAYAHYNSLVSPETGVPIYLYFCDKELRRDWPKHSSIPYDSLDKKGQMIRFTLLRYLASRELTKDAAGLAKLTKKEISAIEEGVGSAENYGIMGRLYGIKYQLINKQDPNGNSLLERLEYWKAAFGIFSENMLVGVGIGDVQDEFDAFYEKNNSPLHKENRHRSHNMYLTVALTFGIPGFLLFMFFHLKLLTFNIRNKEVIGVLFLSVAMISFLMEDTLETQTGITFCTLFYALFSLRIPSLQSDQSLR